MAVTGWLECLRVAEKTALLQDGNSRSPASSLVLFPRVRPSALACPRRASELGTAELEGSRRHPSQVLHLQMRKLRHREITRLEHASLNTL